MLFPRQVSPERILVLKVDVANRAAKLPRIGHLIEVDPQEPRDAPLAVGSLENDVIIVVMVAPWKEIEINPELTFSLLAGLASREGLPYVTSSQRECEASADTYRVWLKFVCKVA